MTWADTWNDIVQGGSQRWKVTDPKAHQKALARMQEYMKEGSNNVLAPLCGDDPMVFYLWQQGHSVTAMDLVPVALEKMRDQFEGTWTRQDHPDNEGMVVWKHESGRAVQYQGDALQPIPELKNSFDAVYDKDSFGALQKEMRKGFTSRIGEYTKPGAIVYLEVKLRDNHEASKDVGPPFSLKKEDLMDTNCYGNMFEYTKGLGSIYEIPMPGVLQTAHILTRK